MEELLQRAADKIGMPPVLAERSAQARAEKEGITVEAVLLEWAGEDSGSDDEATAADEPTPQASDATTEAEPEADAVPSATGPTEVTTDYLVALAAETKRMPPKLVRSSAEARARNSKSDLDTVLAEWAGVDLDELKEQAAAGTAPVAHPPADEPSPEPAATTPEPAPPVEATEEPAPAAAPAAATAAVAALSMDELLDKVAEAKGMPAALAKRSAEARAKKTGEPLEAVLAEWAGVDVASVTDDSSAPAPAPAAAPAAAAGAATISMDELLDKVAEAKGMPAALAKRSAEARAKKTGEPLDAVLAEWAGVDVASIASSEAAPAEAAPAPAAAAPTTEAEPETVAEVEVIEAKGQDADATDAPELA
ncbi:MAG: hypothetical protein ACR2NG_06290, partial [Acidimicrobiia bacterium]